MFAAVHKTLAESGQKFSMKVLEARNFTRDVQAALDMTGANTKRLRALSAYFMMFLVLMLSMHRANSIPNVFKKLLAAVRGWSIILPLKVVTDEALLKACKRLGWRPMKALFELRARLAPRVPSFFGFRVLGVDGTRFSVQDTPMNVFGFGRPQSGRSPGAFPQMGTVTLVDAYIHLVLDCFFQRGSDVAVHARWRGLCTLRAAAPPPPMVSRAVWTSSPAPLYGLTSSPCS